MSKQSDPDFILIIDPFGVVSLYDADDFDENVESPVKWTSTRDDDFTDEFGDELLGDDDVDDILDWLIENDVISADAEVDVEIQDAESLQ